MGWQLRFSIGLSRRRYQSWPRCMDLEIVAECRQHMCIQQKMALQSRALSKLIVPFGILHHARVTDMIRHSIVGFGNQPALRLGIGLTAKCVCHSIN